MPTNKPGTNARASKLLARWRLIPSQGVDGEPEKTA
jgi:hypothetical protein